MSERKRDHHDGASIETVRGKIDRNDRVILAGMGFRLKLGTEMVDAKIIADQETIQTNRRLQVLRSRVAHMMADGYTQDEATIIWRTLLDANERIQDERRGKALPEK